METHEININSIFTKFDVLINNCSTLTHKGGKSARINHKINIVRNEGIELRDGNRFRASKNAGITTDRQ